MPGQHTFRPSTPLRVPARDIHNKYTYTTSDQEQSDSRNDGHMITATPQPLTASSHPSTVANNNHTDNNTEYTLPTLRLQLYDLPESYSNTSYEIYKPHTCTADPTAADDKGVGRLRKSTLVLDWNSDKRSEGFKSADDIYHPTPSNSSKHVKCDKQYEESIRDIIRTATTPTTNRRTSTPLRSSSSSYYSPRPCTPTPTPLKCLATPVTADRFPYMRPKTPTSYVANLPLFNLSDSTTRVAYRNKQVCDPIHSMIYDELLSHYDSSDSIDILIQRLKDELKADDDILARKHRHLGYTSKGHNSDPRLKVLKSSITVSSNCNNTRRPGQSNNNMGKSNTTTAAKVKGWEKLYDGWVDFT